MELLPHHPVLSRRRKKLGIGLTLLKAQKLARLRANTRIVDDRANHQAKLSRTPNRPRNYNRSIVALAANNGVVTDEYCLPCEARASISVVSLAIIVPLASVRTFVIRKCAV